MGVSVLASRQQASRPDVERLIPRALGEDPCQIVACSVLNVSLLKLWLLAWNLLLTTDPDQLRVFTANGRWLRAHIPQEVREMVVESLDPQPSLCDCDPAANA